MTAFRDLVSEADSRSRFAFDNVFRCLDIGNREPLLGPAMVGCALLCAGVGMTIAGIGVTAGVLQAAQAGASTPENTPPH